MVATGQWQQTPDGSWWFLGPDNQWHQSNIPPPPSSPPGTSPSHDWYSSGPSAVHAPAPRSPVPPAAASTLPAGAWMAIAAGLVMGISALLPWVTAHALFTTVNRNAFQLGDHYGFSADGAILIGLGLITITIGITRLVGAAMPRYLQRSTIVTGIGALVVALNRAPSINDLANKVNDASNGLVSASIGYGLWVTVVGGVVAVVAGFIMRSRASTGSYHT